VVESPAGDSDDESMVEFEAIRCRDSHMKYVSASNCGTSGSRMQRVFASKLRQSASRSRSPGVPEPTSARAPAGLSKGVPIVRLEKIEYLRYLGSIGHDGMTLASR